MRPPTHRRSLETHAHPRDPRREAGAADGDGSALRDLPVRVCPGSGGVRAAIPHRGRGQTVTVKPVLGQDTSRLLGGALVRTDHAHIDVLDLDVGVDVDADWNQLIPSDKRTRAYLTALWDDPPADRTPAGRRAPERGDLERRRLPGRVSPSWSGPGPPGLPRRACGATRPSRQTRYAVTTRAAWDAGRGRDRLGAGRGRHGRPHLQHEDNHTVVGSPVFAGPSLEGTEVNGLAAEVLPSCRSSGLGRRSTTRSPTTWSGRSPSGRRCVAPTTRSSWSSRRTSRT